LHLKPDFAVAYHNLGVVQRELGRYLDSAASLQQALALMPNYADGLFNLGLTEINLNQIDAALEHFHAALRINPQHTYALVALGNTHASSGRFVDAENFYNRALQFEPGNLAAWSAIPEIRTMSLADREWLKVSEKIAAQNLSPRERSRLHFALGKYFNDIKEFDTAFSHYHRANELSKLVEVPYNPVAETTRVERLRATFSPSRAAQHHPTASTSERPVFILGMPRSGTSLVEQIVASHPNVVGAGELNFWHNALHQFMPAQPLQALDPALVSGLADAYSAVLDNLSRHAQHIVDKAPHNFMAIGLIHAVFPKARFIHLQRNPIDTCLSIYFQDFASSFSFANDLHNLAHYYQEYVRIMAHWRSIIPASQFLDVSYDALVADQEAGSRKIIEFLGLAWSPRCLEFQKAERAVKTASQWQVRQPMYKTSVERWRKYERHLGPLLGLIPKQ
jgi:tetratricopeptide (TPR) repeat protein